MSLTIDEIKSELKKCGKDPVYFIDNYVKISHPSRGLVPFKLYDFQKDLIRDFQSNRYNIVLKARQLGVTTTMSAYAAWLMLFRRDKNILAVATQRRKAAIIVKKIKLMYKHLPEWLMISEIVVNNKNSIEMSNGSQIVASSTSGDAGRSEAVSLLLVDEAALIENLDELWKGLLPTLSTGGGCLAASTPYGVGTWFHKTYVEGEQQTNLFNAIKLPWEVHPDYDDEWFEKQTKNMSKKGIAQEYLCSFSASGDTVIDEKDIERLRVGIKDPLYRTGADRNVWVWEDFQYQSEYLMCCDVARGDGEDFSSMYIIKLDDPEVVLEYKGKISPDDFSKLIYQTGISYGTCLAVIENANVGYAVLEKLKDMEYPAIYYSSKNSDHYIDPRGARYNPNAVLGFSTSMKTRPLIIAKLEEFIRNDLIKVYSSRFVSELDTFIWKSGRASARKGYNDDLVMAMAIGCFVRDTALITNQRDREYKKAFLDAMSKSGSKLDTKIPGMVGFKRPEGTTGFQERDNDYNIQDFSWVLKG